MNYYRVKISDIYDPVSGYTTISNELLTEKERYKQFPYLHTDCFEMVHVSKKQTYFSFGARFPYSNTKVKKGWL